MFGRIDIPERVVVGVEIPVQTRRVVDLAEEAVLAEETTETWGEVPCLGGEEARLRVPLVTGEGEAVLGGVELFGGAGGAPGSRLVGAARGAERVRGGAA